MAQKKFTAVKARKIQNQVEEYEPTFHKGTEKRMKLNDNRGFGNTIMIFSERKSDQNSKTIEL
jgi:hypothetical protein